MAASAAFYDAVLEPLGGKRVMDFGMAIGYGTEDKPDFWIGGQQTGQGDSDGNNVEAVCHLPELRGRLAR